MPHIDAMDVGFFLIMLVVGVCAVALVAQAVNEIRAAIRRRQVRRDREQRHSFSQRQLLGMWDEEEQ